ncbi:MAG: hypothetical protein A3F74_18560 [Betaproteobacteria bacterium RIFCSPLOWO2_12_FULL_62_58]|nr:MAG: hypothetical protein A3F74_18560 [Betaproteobacteria bacterium RIFCSPLOWO2_12_FULL_62_58]
MREVFLFVHPAFGVLGVLAALWVYVEAYKLDEKRLRRMKVASLVVAGFMLLTWFSGGLWDSFFYEADRAVMEKGSWALVGDTTMELKEHLFVVVLLLALYLPILTFATDLRRDESTRLSTLTVSALIVLLGLAMDGAGVILAGSVHVGMTALLGS